ncbi:MAG TPA: protease modulator HflC [Spongiibacteraceae bacterium]|nr:protease modulator HflC [Spongiibacteraceae bacterium]
MNNKLLIGVLAIAAAVLLLNNSLYIISETERGVLLRFGEVVESDIPIGLHAKFPIVNTVRKFDRRLLTLDAPPERFLTIEKKPLDVDFYAKWRIKDTARFYTATSGDEARAQQLLLQRIKTGLRNQFGERTVHEVVSGERESLMVELTKQLDEIAQSELGVEVVDVRVKRIDLPEQVSQSVFDRMKSERQREAREHRSTGKEQAEKIRAAADREKIVIEANAYREAEQIRGEGDAKAAAIYAAAYKQDPEFYAFQRSLDAYRKSFGHSDDMLVLDPKGDFFKYLNNQRGGR